MDLEAIFEVKLSVGAPDKPATARQQAPEEIVDITTPSKTPKGRAGKLERQQTIRMQTLQEAGDFQAQILRRYRCDNKHCLNVQNHCWIAATGKHYKIKTPQLEAWSNAVQNGETTLHNPPAHLLTYWLSKQGSVDAEKREEGRQAAPAASPAAIPAEGNTLGQIFEFMNRYQLQHGHNQALSTVQQALSLQQPGGLPLLQFLQPFLSSNLSGAPIVASPTRERPGSGDSGSPESALCSSPVPANEDEARYVRAFFEHEIEATIDEHRRDAWKKAMGLAVEHSWGVEDLRKMKKPTSHQYRTACNYGVSEGLTRQFKGKLKLFKRINAARKEIQTAEVVEDQV
jgi:hypothetical protein